MTDDPLPQHSGNQATASASAEKPRCLRCLVSGRVQGVFYRASARNEAQRLGINGYAKNLADGRVEVMACGPPQALQVFKAWLQRGPSAAEVSDVSCESVQCEPMSGFSTA